MRRLFLSNLFSRWVLVARQITDLPECHHEDEPLLDAFEKMARRRLPYVTVLSFSGRLVGVEWARISPFCHRIARLCRKGGWIVHRMWRA